MRPRRISRLLTLLEAKQHQQAVELLRMWEAKAQAFDARHHCTHCGGSDMEKFMVRDSVWQAANMADGFLHLRCLEHRLGRKLVVGDFTDAPINNELKFGYELGRRGCGDHVRS